MGDESNRGAVASTGAEGTAVETSENTGVEATPQEKPVSDMTPAEKKRYRLKIDGEEADYDEDEVVRMAQKGRAADKKFQESSQMRKQSEEFIRLLKEDPRKVLSHPSIGHDLKKFAEDILLEQLQDEMLSPQEKEIREYKSKLAKYEEQERKTKEAEDAKNKESVKAKYAEDYNKQIIDALEAGGLPKTEYTVQRMIYYMSKAIENGYEMSALDVRDLVKRDYQQDTKSLYSGLDSEALLAILGDDVVKKLKKEDIKKVKGFQNNLKNPIELDNEDRPKKVKGMSKDSWREMVAKRSNE